mgnify:CR=1 FL=1
MMARYNKLTSMLFKYKPITIYDDKCNDLLIIINQNQGFRYKITLTFLCVLDALYYSFPPIVQLFVGIPKS